MTSLVSWIANKLEDIDNQAATQAGTDQTTNMVEYDDPALPGLEISALRSNLLSANSKIRSLEEQLNQITSQKAHIEALNNELEQEKELLVEKSQKLELEKGKLESRIKSLERKHAHDNSTFEKTRQNFEDLREKLQKEVAALSQQLSSSQQELSVTKNENAKLESNLSHKEDEVSILEQEISKYRENAAKSLRIESNDSSISAQLEVLENELNRVKDKHNKAQQRILQLEASSRELEEQMQNELNDAKQRQVLLESDLFRTRTQKEAMQHEISLVKAQLTAAQEAAESKYKSQLLSERSAHREEISRLKEEFAMNSRNGKSTEEQLVNALATIESLRGEKAALMLRLETRRGTVLGDSPLVMNVEDVRRKDKMVSLVTVFPGAPGFVRRNVAKVEEFLVTICRFLAKNPRVRTFFVVWIIALHWAVLRM